MADNARMERDTPNPASPSDPPQDQPATAAPSNVGGLLYAVTILLAYGRHLLDTVRHRATAASFLLSRSHSSGRTRGAIRRRRAVT